MNEQKNQEPQERISQGMSKINNRDRRTGRLIYRLVLWAVFAALVFASNWLSIPIPVAVGAMTRIHLANVFCLLSGFILGPVGGGLAAGIGSALYDMTNPAYILSSPFTFAFKFLLAAVCGWIAHAGGRKAENHKWNILAAVSGSAAYMILYLGKSFIEGLLLGNELGTILTAVGTKAVTSGINAVIAVAVSLPLCAVIRAALKRAASGKSFPT